MAACCAAAAFVIWRFMSLYHRLSPPGSRACNEHVLASAEDEGPGLEATRSCRLRLRGLTCVSCALSIESSLGSCHGLIDASVSFQSLSASIQYNPSFGSPEEFIAQVKSAGYGAELVEDADDWQASWLAASRSRCDSIKSLQRAMVVSAIIFVTILVSESFLAKDSHGARIAVFWSCFNIFVASAAVIVVAMPIHQESLKALRRRRLISSTLSSLGLIMVLLAAAFTSVRTNAGGRSRRHSLSSSALLVTVIMGSRMIKSLLSQQGVHFMTAFAQATPPRAAIVLDRSVEDSTIRSIRTELLQPGDHVLVRSYERFPADAMVIRGQSTLDRAILNGESAPKSVGPGDTVYAGCTNGPHAIVAKVIRPGKSSLISQAIAALSKAHQIRHARAQDVSETYLAWLNALALLVAVGVIISSFQAGVELDQLLEQTATVLLCACPCAVGVGTPMLMMVAATNARGLGILLKPGPSLSYAAQTKAVVFDKTGTLTCGDLKLERIRWEGKWAEGRKENELFWPAVHILSTRSEHPVSRLLHSIATERISSRHVASPPHAHEFHVEEIPGQGLLGRLFLGSGESQVAIGNTRLMQSQNVYFAPDYFHEIESPSACSDVFVSINAELAACITYSDSAVPGASQLVHSLHARGLKTFMMTGDTVQAAMSISKQVGINESNVFASLSPSDKARKIEHLERKLGRTVMVGDNINDGPALFTATFGIVLEPPDDHFGSRLGANRALMSLRTEADAHILPSTSDVVSCGPGWPVLKSRSESSTLSLVLYLIDLARETDRRIMRLLRGSVIYNMIVLGLASNAFRFLPFDIVGTVSFEPMHASLAMAMSSIMTLVYCLTFQRWTPSWA